MPRVIITVPDGQPQPYSFDLDRQLVTIGRAHESDILPNGGAVSTNHAQMERISGGFILRDLDSTNGTKLDGVEYSVIDLHDGIEVILGDVTFDFTLDEDELMSLADEPFSPHQKAKTIQTDDPPPAPAKVTPATPAAAPPIMPQTYQPQSGGGFSGIFFLLVSILCVGLGLTLRHYHETGRFILDDLSAPAIEQPAK